MVTGRKKNRHDLIEVFKICKQFSRIRPKELFHFDDKGKGTTGRVVVSVSTSRSRDGLETYQRLVSVSSRRKLSMSRSRLGLGH